jgi:5-(carboxyamino)imidazole ribonucleotide synthase
MTIKTLGILGGGQLAAFIAQAARTLGISPIIMTPHADDPAVAIADKVFIAPWRDAEHLDQFSRACDVITVDSENIDYAALNYLCGRAVLRPSLAALGIFQDRLSERTFLQALNIPSVPFAAIAYDGDIRDAMAELGLPAVLKTRFGGYDGKGQTAIQSTTQAQHAFMQIAEQPAIYEKFINFSKEISCVGARGLHGQIEFYDLIENQNENHMLRQSVVPAAVSETIQQQAQQIFTRIVQALDYVGVLAVEFFLLPDNTLLVNEIAPRVHNTGHFTLDACLHSQFTQHVRAICGLPLGTTQRLANATMRNIVGEEVYAAQQWLYTPNAALYLYGKKDARAGRKMGHVTTLSAL